MPIRTKMGYDEILEEVLRGSSRGAALIAGAWIEEVLRGVIRHFMVELTSSEEKILFRGYGPLSTFSSKITLAYSLGIIGKKTRHDLNAIRKIRNDFAHSLHDIDLNEASIATKIQNLNSLQNLENMEEKSPQEKLAAAVETISLFLIVKAAPEPPNEELRVLFQDLD